MKEFMKKNIIKSQRTKESLHSGKRLFYPVHTLFIHWSPIISVYAERIAHGTKESYSVLWFLASSTYLACMRTNWSTSINFNKIKTFCVHHWVKLYSHQIQQEQCWNLLNWWDILFLTAEISSWVLFCLKIRIY